MTEIASDQTVAPAETAPAAAAPAPDPTPTPAPEPAEPAGTTEAEDATVVTAEIVPADDTTPAETEPEKWVHRGDWPYDWIEYKGDRLAIRIPSPAALTAMFQAAQSCSEEFQLKLTNKFVKSHLSQESLERVLERMVDPDDEEVSGISVWSDLLRQISELGQERVAQEAAALAEVTSGSK